MKKYLICSFIVMCLQARAEDIILRTDWSAAQQMKFENTVIVPVKGQGDYKLKDTITYSGTLGVINTNPEKTIMELVVLEVTGSISDSSENAEDTYNIWQAIQRAGKIQYALTAKGTFDTIVNIDSLQAAVQFYCALMEYDCEETTPVSLEDVPDSIVSTVTVEGDFEDDDYGLDWDDSDFSLDMTPYIKDAIMEALGKKLELLHAYAGDTLQLGISRDVRDFPEFYEVEKEMADMMTIEGSGLLTDAGDHYLYQSHATIDMGKMMQMLFDAFSSLDDEEGKKKKGKKKKDKDKETIPASLLNISIAMDMDYKLEKGTLIPLDFAMETITDVPVTENMKEKLSVSASDHFRVIR